MGIPGSGAAHSDNVPLGGVSELMMWPWDSQLQSGEDIHLLRQTPGGRKRDSLLPEMHHLAAGHLQ